MIGYAHEPSGPDPMDIYSMLLLSLEWDHPHTPLRLDARIPAKALAGSAFLNNARLLLTTIARSKDGVAATATGNLNRDLVRQFAVQMRLDPLIREGLLAHYKAFNEQDVWRLHEVRVVCEIAGLLARRKNRFRVTRVGASLLGDDQAGGLFHKLFVTFFRKFDLRYSFDLRDVPSIQHYIGEILWRLDSTARDWVPVQGLAPKVMPPPALEQMHMAMTYEHDTEEWILAGYVLNPLREFGLLERQKKSDWPGIEKHDSIRTTGLWRQFLSFRPQSG